MPTYSIVYKISVRNLLVANWWPQGGRGGGGVRVPGGANKSLIHIVMILVLVFMQLQ